MTKILIGILVITTILLTAPLTISDADAVPLCDGKEPTILAENLEEDKHKIILGTDSDDVIYIWNKKITHSIILAGQGNDTICLRGGGHLVFAGSGDDTVISFSSSNTIYGGRGNDTIYGDTGADTILGEDGNDFIDGGGAQGTVKDYLSGGLGKDTIYGSGNAVVEGNEGSDTLYYGKYILGGDGDDIIYGKNNDSKIHGGNGDDLIDAGKGTDVVDGGSGKDTCIHSVKEDSNYEIKFPDVIECEKITIITS